MKTLVIINPTAAGGLDAADVGRRLAGLLDAEIAITRAPGHAVDLAADTAAGGYSRVVAVGGDGTVREVVTGLWRGSTGKDRAIPPASLGLIPAGTGNDLARSLNLPLELEAAARIAAGPRTRPLDLVRARSVGGPAEERVMANAAVAGFCGRIGESMSPAFRQRWRRLAYPAAAVFQLRDLRPYRVRIEVDGELLETRVLMLIMANSRFAGGQVPFAPDARTDDGLLDLVVIEAAGPLALARLVPRVFRGTHVGLPGVRIVRARTVLLHSESPMWINLDGDTWQAGAAEFQVLPSALEVRVP